MPDMLVKLYDLPEQHTLINRLQEQGIVIRRPIGPEKHIVTEWVRRKFRDHWKSECEVSFSRVPISCFIAVENGKMLGFACYDATVRGFFGPTGVDQDYRGKGIGKALLLACLHAMYNEGYAYAVIGGAGPVDFYAKSVGAIPIEGSSPGIYRGMMREVHG
jgi:GNAT superfamily N-acetyltransferase